ncbi:MAG TPA: hypothetical protein VHE55_00275 [Fimbriimonadaceae bacterium]|nr:hypothetical protein [Fimbriimonadaceae bacterium]
MLLAGAQAIAQGGGGIGSPAYDANPSNPDNWQISISKSGSDETHGWHTVSGADVQDDNTYAWPQVTHPATFDLDPRHSASDSTGHGHGSNAISQGDVTLTFTWVSPYPQPSYVIVRIASNCIAEFSAGADVNLSDGLGAPMILSPDGLSASCSATQLRKLNVNGGVATVTITSAGAVTASGPTSMAAVEVGMVDAAIEPKAVFVEPWISPTYGGPGPHDMPIYIENPDPTNIQMYLGLATQVPDVLYSLDGSLQARTWGNWTLPTPFWAWSDVFGLGTDPWVAQIQRTFTNAEVADIAKNGPRELDNSVTVTDLDGTSRSAQVRMFLYAPEQFPVLNHTEEKYDEFGRVSAIFHRNPYGTTKCEETIAYAEAITKTLIVGGGSIGTTKDSPVVIALNLPTAQFGETATITMTSLFGVILNAGPDDHEFWLEKRNFWMEDSGFYEMFLADGYHGLGNLTFKHWVSGTKEAAERQDHEFRMGSRPWPN